VLNTSAEATDVGKRTSGHGNRGDERHDRRLANPLPIERTWSQDHDAMLAALRVVLGLPRRPVSFFREDRP